jgi:SSS family solute:Na+ symporter
MNPTGTLSLIDWLVMGGTILLIVLYGIWRSRGAKDIRSYLLSNKEMKWWTIGLSVMATQASAITFLSTPGQAFDDGMRFVQFYLGMPIAIIIIASVFIPLYHKLQVYTAYEYLERRFDMKTRTLGAFLFLISRSIASGLTISAPALILAVALDWNLYLTTVLIGGVVILYTLLGGTKAVAITHKYQMGVIFLGMVIAGVIMVLRLPEDVSFGDAVFLAGKMGKLNAFTLPASWSEFVNDRYNLLTGLIGGTFLALSYFGTDQSQVQRYLGGRSAAQMRVGLLFNAMVKVPMQFLILFLGALMFIFFLFSTSQSSVLYDKKLRTEIAGSGQVDQYMMLEELHDSLGVNLQRKAGELLELKAENIQEVPEYELEYRKEEAVALSEAMKNLTRETIGLVKTDENAVDRAMSKNRDYVFLTFVLNMLPVGLVGLLIAVILSAAMSSTASELNALASTTAVDIYKRLVNKEGTDRGYLQVSKLFTLLWGLVAIGIAIIALDEENLIQAVNHWAPSFYGPILGLFVAAFFFKRLQRHPRIYRCPGGRTGDSRPGVSPQVDARAIWRLCGCLSLVQPDRLCHCPAGGLPASALAGRRKSTGSSRLRSSR